MEAGSSSHRRDEYVPFPVCKGRNLDGWPRTCSFRRKSLLIVIVGLVGVLAIQASMAYVPITFAPTRSLPTFPRTRSLGATLPGSRRPQVVLTLRDDMPSSNVQREQRDGSFTNTPKLVGPPRRKGLEQPPQTQAQPVQVDYQEVRAPRKLVKSGNESGRSKADRGEGQEAHIQVNLDRLPDNLTMYQDASQLIIVLQPFAQRFTTAEATNATLHIRAAGAVAAMNHLKRCERSAKDFSVRDELDRLMRVFADVAEEGLYRLTAKHVSLVVNAVAERHGYTSLLAAASQRALALCGEFLAWEARPDSKTADADEKRHLDSTLDGRAVGLILNAFSKAHVYNTTLYNAMASVAMKLGHTHKSLGGQNIGLILNAFSKARMCHPLLFSSLSKAVQAMNSSSIDVQALSNVVNAFANVGIVDEPLFSRVSEIALQHPEEVYSAQSIANIANAFARQGKCDKQLLAFLASAARKLPPYTFTAQSISTIINGYAKLGYCDEALMRFLSMMAQKLHPKDFSPQAVSVIVNGYSKCGMTDKRLFEYLGEIVLGMTHLEAHTISNAMHAFVRAGLGNQRLYEHLANEMLALVPAGSVEKVGGRRKREATVTDIAILMASFEKAEMLSDELVDHAWKLVQPLSHDITAHDLSGLMHTLSKQTHTHPEFTGMLIQTLESRIGSLKFGMQSLCMTIAACARLQTRPSAPTIRQLLQVALDGDISDYDMIGVISVLGACASIKQPDDVALLTGSLTSMMRERVMMASESELTPSICISLLGALANVGLLPSDAALRAKMQGVVVKVVSNMQQREGPQKGETQANSVSALTVSLLLAGEDSDIIWDALTRAVCSIRRGGWNSRALPTVLNSYARAGRNTDKVFETCSQVIRTEIVGEGEPAAQVRGGSYELWGLEPGAIASILNSYAKVERFDEPLFRRLSVLAQIHDPSLFEMSHVANIVNAFARSRIEDQNLFAHMSAAIKSAAACNKSVDSIAISLIANAYARVCTREKGVSEHVFDDITTLAVRVPDAEWTPQTAANILNAFARVQRRDDTLLKAVCRAMANMEASVLDLQSVASAFHALAVLHMADTQLVCRLAGALSQLPTATSSPQAAANLAWSYAVMRPFILLANNLMSIGSNQSDGTILAWIWDAIAATFSSMDRSCLSQVHQLLVTCELDETPLPPKMKADMVSACRRAFKEGAESLQMVSTLQADVAKSLKGLGYAIEEEVLEAKTGYSLDMLIPSQRIVVEVDGPFHFCKGSKQPLGSTVLKQRHLRRLGYVLVSVPYWEWNVNAGLDYKEIWGEASLIDADAVADEDNKRAYLERQIKLALESAQGAEGQVPLE